MKKVTFLNSLECYVLWEVFVYNLVHGGVCLWFHWEEKNNLNLFFFKNNNTTLFLKFD